LSTPPACLIPGLETRVCALDASHIETRIVDPLGHNFDSWETTLSPNCSVEGSESRTCQRCAEIETRSIAIDPSAHSWGSWLVTTPAACLTDGLETRVCSHNALHIETRIVERGHNISWIVTNVIYPATSTGSCTVCDYIPVPRTTQIGDTGPAGGIIFHIDPTGFTVQGYSAGTGTTAHLNFDGYTAHYLEAAPENMATTLQWVSFWNNDLIPLLSQNETDQTDWAIGRGRMNTSIIIARGLTVTPPYTTPAASACIELTTGEKTDWFLPSRNELDALAQIRGQHGIPNTGPGGFRSSSQIDNNHAWVLALSNGDLAFSTKISSIDVRAVRAF